MQDEKCWKSLFFDENNIVSTFQNLLLKGTQTIDELYHLCVVAHESELVLGFTMYGLCPFVTHKDYIIPFESMSKTQLQCLRSTCKQLGKDPIAFDYGVDFYIVHDEQSCSKIDDALMLFAAMCIIWKGLSCTSLKKHGYERLILHYENSHLHSFV